MTKSNKPPGAASPIAAEDAQRRLLAGREYIGVDRIDGPLVFVKNTHPVGYRELVECVDPKGVTRLGIVLDTSAEVVVVQVFGTSGLAMPGTRVRSAGMRRSAERTDAGRPTAWGSHRRGQPGRDRRWTSTASRSAPPRRSTTRTSSGRDLGDRRLNT
jgi:hypothetical protein